MNKHISVSCGFLTGWLILAGVARPAGAAEVRPVTVEDILTVKRLSDPRIAPDGTRVAYVVTEADLVENVNRSDVWVVSTEGGSPQAIQLTRGVETDNHPRWSPDGSKVAFLSDRGDKPQIYLISIRGGEAMALTEHRAGISSFAWSPEGRKLAFLAEVPLTEEEEKQREQRPIVVDTDYRYQQLWSVDVETKEVVRLVEEDLHLTELDWAPQGNQIAVVGRPTPRNKDSKFSDIYLILPEAEGGRMRKVSDGPSPKSAPHFLADGSLVYESPNGLWTFNRRIYRAESSGADPVAVTTEHDENAYYVGSTSDGATLLFRARIRTHSDFFTISASGGTPTPLSDGKMVITGASSSRDGSKVAFVGHTPTEPPEVYVSQVGSYQPQRLTDTNPQTDQFALGEQEVIRWKSSDGLEIEGVLVKPVGYEPGKKYPLLLLIHGGPSGVWTNGFNLRNSAYPTQVFAGQGYAIIMPNPRGSTAYGEKHRRGNWQDLSGKEWDDCHAGVDEVIRMGIGDPERVGIMGWSYGGHLTYWGITQTDRFKAGSAGAGANNLVSMYSQTDLPGFYSDNYFGFPPWKRFDFYWERSSLSQVAKVKTPLLIQVGENDRRVPKTQSIEFYTALKDLGVPTELVIYPRQPHGVREPKLVLDLLQRNVDWFDKWVLGKDSSTTNP